MDVFHLTLQPRYVSHVVIGVITSNTDPSGPSSQWTLGGIVFGFWEGKPDKIQAGMWRTCRFHTKSPSHTGDCVFPSNVICQFSWSFYIFWKCINNHSHNQLYGWSETGIHLRQKTLWHRQCWIWNIFYWIQCTYWICSACPNCHCHDQAQVAVHDDVMHYYWLAARLSRKLLVRWQHLTRKVNIFFLTIVYYILTVEN